MIRSPSLAPAGRFDGSYCMLTVTGGLKVAPVGPSSRAATSMSADGGGGGGADGGPQVIASSGTPFLSNACVPLGIVTLSLLSAVARVMAAGVAPVAVGVQVV